MTGISRPAPVSSVIEAAETCSCGASVKLVYDNTSDYAVLLRFLRAWRVGHRCEKPSRRINAIGFPLPGAYDDDDDDGGD
jgi:hypothetical protein